MNIDITVPSGWDKLTQAQLRYLLGLMLDVQQVYEHDRFRDIDDYSAQTRATVATYCLLHWSGMEVVTPYADGFLVRYGGVEFPITAGQLAPALSSLDWIRDIPPTPVRLDIVDGAEAASPDLQGFPFENYLACENLWQGYQATRNGDLLRHMGELLYGKENITMTGPELLGVFYWWASVKKLFSSTFPHFYQPVADTSLGDGTPAIDEETLRRSVNAQIRALTKGDVTKETQILSLDTWRALTELDAQAREYEELNKKYPSKS